MAFSGCGPDRARNGAALIAVRESALEKETSEPGGDYLPSARVKEIDLSQTLDEERQSGDEIDGMDPSLSKFLPKHPDQNHACRNNALENEKRLFKGWKIMSKAPERGP